MSNEHLTIDDIGEFTWNFASHFLIETSKGTFVWSDPDYMGDNTIRPYVGNKANFTEEGFMGRCKGTHVIGEYCGKDVVIL